MVPRPPRQQRPGFASQQQPGFAGQQQPEFTGQQQSGFTGQQQPGLIGPAGTQGWQAPWGGQPMMQGWGPQGGQPPFPLGTDGSRIGQLNPLYDITGGFSKEAQRIVDLLVKEMGVEGRKNAYESVLHRERCGGSRTPQPATSDCGAGGYWGGRRKLPVTAVHRVH